MSEYRSISMCKHAALKLQIINKWPRNSKGFLVTSERTNSIGKICNTFFWQGFQIFKKLFNFIKMPPNCTKKIETRGLIMAAPVTREKVFKIIFLFISSFKSYVNSEHKVKKNFLLKNNDFSPIFQYACIPVSSFVPLVLFLYCSRDVHNIRKLITKKNHNLWHCSALQDNFFLYK